MHVVSENAVLMYQRGVEKQLTKLELRMTSGGEIETGRSVKRKLFVDSVSACSPPAVKQFRRARNRRWRPTCFRSRLREGDVNLSDSDDCQSVADSQETFSEFDSGSNVSSDSSYIQSPNSPHEEVFDLDFCEEDNFTWLLNFKVESLFQTPWDHSVAHDHNYRSISIDCSKIMIEKNGLSPESFTNEYSQISVRGKRKPPYTYTELIELALRDQGELTVSGIYKWIMDHFPFFQATDDRWKNSVRHNLSINANFKKGRKPQGSSHLWTIASDSEKKFKQELMCQSTKSQWKRSLEGMGHLHAISAPYRANGVTEESVASLHQQNQPINKSAEEILNGDVEKKVEVQLVTPLRPLAYTFLLESREFLNPVTQKEVVQESGLLDDTQVVHSLPQQIFNSLCSEMEPSGDLFDDDLALSYLNISP